MSFSTVNPSASLAWGFRGRSVRVAPLDLDGMTRLARERSRLMRRHVAEPERGVRLFAYFAALSAHELTREEIASFTPDEIASMASVLVSLNPGLFPDHSASVPQ
jgi:hypothetical protein